MRGRIIFKKYLKNLKVNNLKESVIAIKILLDLNASLMFVKIIVIIMVYVQMAHV